MLKTLMLSLSLLVATSTIYKFRVESIDGSNINFEQFKGKTILLVNIASASKYVDQLYNLERLYQKYKDRLVVIAVPSNSFGNEDADNNKIKDLVRDYYGGHFLITQKMEVAGSRQAPLFRWLSQRVDNEVMSNEVRGDFQKYLVGPDGQFIGYFNPGVDPFDMFLQQAIEGAVEKQ